MKALRKLNKGRGNISYVDIEKPICGDEDVIVEVRYAGICGTDIHIFEDEFSGYIPPVTLGHEFSGIVSEKGSKVFGVAIGDKVTVESCAETCGVCEACRSGETQLCSHRKAFGIAIDGGFAEFVKVPSKKVLKIPENVSLKEAAMTEPISVAVHAVCELSSINNESTVLITGPGTIGLLVLEVALTEASKIILCGTEKDEERLSVGKKIGGDKVTVVLSDNLKETVNIITDSEGVEIAFECSGNQYGVKSCIKSCKKGGEIIQVGLTGSTFELFYDDFALNEITLKGSFTHNRKTWIKSLDILSLKKIDVNPLISEDSLVEWEQIFNEVKEGKGIKYLLMPNKI